MRGTLVRPDEGFPVQQALLRPWAFCPRETNGRLTPSSTSAQRTRLTRKLLRVRTRLASGWRRWTRRGPPHRGSRGWPPPNAAASAGRPRPQCQTGRGGQGAGGGARGCARAVWITWRWRLRSPCFASIATLSCRLAMCSLKPRGRGWPPLFERGGCFGDPGESHAADKGLPRTGAANLGPHPFICRRLFRGFDGAWGFCARPVAACRRSVQPPSSGECLQAPTGAEFLQDWR